MTFSPSDAALEGFHVLRRHWRVVVGWAGFNIVGMVAVVIVGLVIAVGVVATQAIDENALGGFTPLVVVIGDLLIQTIVAVGLYRMLLKPEAPGFLHLRVGRDEARLLGVIAICAVAFGVISWAAYLLGKALAAQIAWAPLIVGVAAVALTVWLSLRFALVGPIIVVENRINFGRSWRLTRGKAWPLFGMWFLNFFVVLMVWVVWWILAFLLVGMLTGFGEHGEGADAFVAHPVRYLLEGASPLLFAPVFLVLQQTPYVEAYKALSGYEAGET